MPEVPILSPRSAFAGLLAPIEGIGPAGVTVEDRCGLGLATVLARQGREAALDARIGERYGLALPKQPRRASAGDVAFIGIGPGKWLAVREDADGWVEELACDLAGLAAVVDQSDGLAVVRVAGPRVRETLAKGVPVDLHPRAFAPGDAAVTAAAHVGLTLWQTDDAPTYELALFRSLASSFWHWLSSSAAEFGLEVAPRPAASATPG